MRSETPQKRRKKDCRNLRGQRIPEKGRTQNQVSRVYED